jgi:hypothetical protein
MVSEIVQNVWDSAKDWGHLGIHEATWIDRLVSPLLHIPEKLKCFKEPNRLYVTLQVLDV